MSYQDQLQSLLDQFHQDFKEEYGGDDADVEKHLAFLTTRMAEITVLVIGLQIRITQETERINELIGKLDEFALSATRAPAESIN